MSNLRAANDFDGQANRDPRPRNATASRLRKLVICGTSLLGILLAAVLVLPSILGSRWVYQPLLERLEAGQFNLQVDSVRLRWFSPLELNKVVVQETNGAVLLTVAAIKTDRGLLGYLLSGRRIGRIEFIKPSVDIEFVTDETNLGQLIEAVEGKIAVKDAARLKSKPALDVDIAVRGMTATVKRPELPDPLIVIPTFDVDIAYRAADGHSHVSLQPTTLLDHVQLTPELIKLGLGYAIPLLAESAWFDGRISLSTEAIDIPLDDPRASTGAAVMTLHQVRSGPTKPVIVNALDLIAKMRNREPHHELVFVDGSKVAIRAADSRIHHEGLKFGLPKVDARLQMSTSGSVGLKDKALDLTLEFPVPVEQLARRDSVKELGVPMVKLPIVGTLDEPKVEWSALREDSADLIGMIRDKVKEESPATAAVLGGLESLADGKADEAIAAAADLFSELRARRQAKLKQQSEADDPSADSPKTTEQKAERKPQPIRDALRDLLKKK